MNKYRVKRRVVTYEWFDVEAESEDHVYSGDCSDEEHIDSYFYDSQIDNIELLEEDIYGDNEEEENKESQGFIIQCDENGYVKIINPNKGNIIMCSTCNSNKGINDFLKSLDKAAEALASKPELAKELREIEIYMLTRQTTDNGMSHLLYKLNKQG